MTGRLIDTDDINTLFEIEWDATKALEAKSKLEAFTLGIQSAIEEFQKLPTVDAIPFKWIPFSEQKPSKTDDYLITYPISHEHTYVAIDQWLAEEGKWEAFRTEAVIAWAEIPKPYERKEE